MIIGKNDRNCHQSIIVITYEPMAEASRPFLTTWLSVAGSRRRCRPTLSNSLPESHKEIYHHERGGIKGLEGGSWWSNNMKTKNTKTNLKSTNKIAIVVAYMQIDGAFAGVGKGRWSHHKQMNFLKKERGVLMNCMNCIFLNDSLWWTILFSNLSVMVYEQIFVNIEYHSIVLESIQMDPLSEVKK